MKMKVLVAQSCLTLCDLMDCSLQGSSVHEILEARILEWVYRFLLQGIFPTQGWNLGLLHCRQILYHLSHREDQFPEGILLFTNRPVASGLSGILIFCY